MKIKKSELSKSFVVELVADDGDVYIEEVVEWRGMLIDVNADDDHNVSYYSQFDTHFHNPSIFLLDSGLWTCDIVKLQKRHIIENTAVRVDSACVKEVKK